MGTHNSCPPEDGAEEAIIVLLLDEGGARNVKIEIRVPSSNFGRLLVIRISQVGADNRQRGQRRAIRSSRVTRLRSKAYIRRLFRVQSIHDAGVKKKNHVIFVGAIVDRPICRIIVVL